MNDFINYNKMDIINDDNNIKVKVMITEEALNPFNIVHGGLIFSIGDTAMGVKCRSLGRDAFTLNSSINFISPGTGKYLIATSRIIKNGSKTCVLDCEIKNDKNKLVATMSGTYFYVN